MTRMLSSLVLLFLAVTFGSAQPVSAQQGLADTFDHGPDCDSAFTSWELDQRQEMEIEECVRAAELAEAQALASWEEDRLPWRCDRFEGCYLFDEATERASQDQIVPTTATRNPIFESPQLPVIKQSLLAFKPVAIDVFQSVYKALTWNGLDPTPATKPSGPAMMDMAPVSMAGEVAAIPAAQPPAPASSATFDVEQAIVESWRVIEGQIAPQHAPSEMDDYWTYYSDCDRWGIVFADATPAPAPRTQLWSLLGIAQVQQALNLGHESACEIASLVSAHAEFQMVEAREHRIHLWPAIDFSEMLRPLAGRLQQLNRSLTDIPAMVQDHLATHAEAWHVQYLHHLVHEYVQHRRAEDERMVKAYLAPRLNWLSQQLGDVAASWESSADIARDENTSLK